MKAAGLAALVAVTCFSAGVAFAQPQDLGQGVIGNSGLPVRVTFRAGPAALQENLADFMQGGAQLGVTLDVPLMRSLWLDAPFTTLRHRPLVNALSFPYTVAGTYESTFADARGYFTILGLGLKLQPRLDLKTCAQDRVWRMEPSLRAGFTRAYLGGRLCGGLAGRRVSLLARLHARGRTAARGDPGERRQPLVQPGALARHALAGSLEVSGPLAFKRDCALRAT